jgi:membrane protein
VTRIVLRAWNSLRQGGRAAWMGFVDFYNSDDLTFASSIAYYSLLSLFPFLLLVMAAMGRWSVGDQDATLLQLVARAVPGHLDFLSTQIQALSKVRLEVSAAGLFLALWGSMGMFGAVTSAINHAWGVEKRPSFWKHKLVALSMLAVSGLLLMIALLLVSTVQMAQANWFSNVITRVPALGSLRGFVVSNSPTPLFMLVAGLLYYYVPNAKVKLRDVWWGAVIAGLLWRTAFAGFSWYVSDLSRFTVHGQVAAVAVFLVWIYLSAVIFLYGAEVSAAYAKLRTHRAVPPPLDPPAAAKA